MCVTETDLWGFRLANARSLKARIVARNQGLKPAASGRNHPKHLCWCHHKVIRILSTWVFFFLTFFVCCTWFYLFSSNFPFACCDRFSLPRAPFAGMLMMARPASVITKTLDVAAKLPRRKDQHYARKMTSRWAADSGSISESLGFPMKRTARRG